MADEERKHKRKTPKKNSLFGFGIGDCPIWIYKEFVSDVDELYQGYYWVKLMTLIQKAQAYDYMLSNTAETQPLEDIVEEPKERKKPSKDTGVLTMGGVQK